MKSIKKFAKKVLQRLGLVKLKSRPSIKEWEEQVRMEIVKPVKMLLPFIKDGAIFIDIGANVGVFTEAILSARKNIKAHLFEPVPKYNEWLINKFSKNTNVIINKVALSKSNGQFSIWIDDENLGWNTMIREKISNNMQEITIEAISFDDYVLRNNILNIDAIKIDVEGAEFNVLKGMKNTLTRLEKKPVIICEVGWGKNSHPNWEEEVEIFEWLFNNGYKRFDYNNITSTIDVLFIPD